MAAVPGIAADPWSSRAAAPTIRDVTPGTWAASAAGCEPPPPDWPTVLTSPPLLTNPSTPWAASGAGKLCAFTVRLGSESPPTVYRAVPVYPVTTSTCPSNTTQSPGCGR